jgi:large-conductance mechanosensitive channel
LEGVTPSVKIAAIAVAAWSVDSGGSMSSVLKEFRDFLMRGNLIELAVAFVMGLAFAAAAVFFFIVKPVQMMLARRTTRDAEEEAPSDEERRHQELIAAVRGLAR